MHNNNKITQNYGYRHKMTNIVKSQDYVYNNEKYCQSQGYAQ